MMRLLRLVVVFASLALPAHAAETLRFIGAVTVPNDAMVDGTRVGGLSGLDYDPKTELWVSISDDRSDYAPARFYILNLAYGLEAFTAVDIVRAVTLRQADGMPFPPSKAPSGEVVDPEAIRVDPQSGQMWWTTEGDRRRALDPAVKIANPDGSAVTTLPTPEMFRSYPDRERGARNNLSFEGLAFAPDGNSLYVAMETATYQDGPVATVEAGTLARITKIDRAGKVLAQYAYPVDPIQARPTGQHADNGVSEVLGLDDHRLWLVEHCGVEGADGIWKNYIRIYEVDVAGATDISGIESLAGANVTPLAKRLVLDLNKDERIGRIDNIEGMSFGPLLANGHRSLVVVSDNNFNPAQVTQFLAFEIVP